MNAPSVIGIDLDNTIINYNNAFIHTVSELDFISEEWLNYNLFISDEISPKTLIKNHLLTLDEGQYKWEFLQGHVYGKFINYAEVFPGVVNFLAHCKRRGKKVVVVSHKTEFGHYDESKTSLRKAALSFLEANDFFSNNYGINKKDVYFSNTRRSKVKKISELECDFFIDDLLEVFNEPHFPKTTTKILFKNKTQTVDQSFNSWFKINEFFFKNIEPEDVSFYAEKATKQSVKWVKKIHDSGNSSIFRIEMKSGDVFAGKLYPDPTLDDRGRIEKEKKACEFFQLNNFQNVSKIICSEKNLNFGLFKWIDGSKEQKISNNDVREAIAFVRALVAISKTTNYEEFDLASAACISGKMIEEQILERFQKINGAASLFPNLQIFLKEKLAISIEEIINFCKKNWHGEFSGKLPIINQLLSPSDFGFHNAIRTEKGLQFIDFEYFGWDDPVKLTSDFLLHPGMSLTEKQKKLWAENMASIFSSDHSFKQRLEQSYSLFGLCWCLILLNNFVTDEDAKRETVSGNSQVKIKQMQQLDKSEKLLKSLNQSYKSGFPYG